MIKLIWPANINWQALSAIGTLGVMFFNAYLLFLQVRSLIKVTVTAPPRYANEKKSQIVIANHGNKPETILRVLYQDKKDGKFRELSQSQGFALPIIIPAHGIESCDFPYFASNEEQIIDIVVEDATGKRWHCDKKNLSNAKKLLSKHKGIGGIMFDKDKSE